jgi:solute carrier family 30 (zinc transporter), member 5/7
MHGIFINKLGMLLHIISDALGSVGVIISSLLIQYYNMHWADPLCSLCIGILTIYGSWPLLVQSTNTLLQKSSPDIQSSLDNSIYSIKRINGVLDIQNIHCWELYQGYHVFTCIAVIQNGVDTEFTLQAIRSHLGFVQEVCVQIETDKINRY